MTRAFWIIGFIAAFIVVVFLFGCTVTDTPPQDPQPVCREYGFGHDGQDSSWVVECGTVINPKGLGTANNTLGARGME